jgi:hypothetical protein
MIKASGEYKKFEPRPGYRQALLERETRLGVAKAVEWVPPGVEVGDRVRVSGSWGSTEYTVTRIY